MAMPARLAAKLDAGPGKRPIEKRMYAYVPSLSMIAARITEPAVGACTCASGSHVCSGHIGTLMKKAIEKAQKHRPCGDLVTAQALFQPPPATEGPGSTTRESERKSNDHVPVIFWCVHTRYTIAASI